MPSHLPDPRFRFFCSTAVLRLAPPLPWPGECDDDAVQRPQLLLGAVRPLEQGADVAYSGRALLDVAEEAGTVQLLLQVGEELVHLRFRRRAAIADRQRLRDR